MLTPFIFAFLVVSKTMQIRWSRAVFWVSLESPKWTKIANLSRYLCPGLYSPGHKYLDRLAILVHFGLSKDTQNTALDQRICMVLDTTKNAKMNGVNILNAALDQRICMVLTYPKIYQISRPKNEGCKHTKCCSRPTNLHGFDIPKNLSNFSTKK